MAFGDINKPEWAVEGNTAYIIHGTGFMQSVTPAKIVRITNTQITVEHEQRGETVKRRFQMPKYGTRIEAIGTKGSYDSTYLYSEMDGLHEIARKQEEKRLNQINGAAMTALRRANNRGRWFNATDVEILRRELAAVAEQYKEIGQEVDFDRVHEFEEEEAQKLLDKEKK